MRVAGDDIGEAVGMSYAATVAGVRVRVAADDIGEAGGDVVRRQVAGP